MSTLKADAVTSAQDNTALTLSGTGTGGVKVNDFLIQTKGSDIASDTALTLGKDGNQFDVTGTTTITSIATQGIGSIVTLHFDGALTFTHHSTNLILPGAANITTAAGDIAVMYEYASADWRCVSYTKASGAAIVAGGGLTMGTEQDSSSGSSVTFGSIPAGTTLIILAINGQNSNTDVFYHVTIGDAGGLETSGYVGGAVAAGPAQEQEDSTSAWRINALDQYASDPFSGLVIMSLEDSSNFTWTYLSILSSVAVGSFSSGYKALSAELTQLKWEQSGGSNFTAGAVNIQYM
jgi:hypothetical protein